MDSVGNDQICSSWEGGGEGEREEAERERISRETIGS